MLIDMIATAKLNDITSFNPGEDEDDILLVLIRVIIDDISL